MKMEYITAQIGAEVLALLGAGEAELVAEVSGRADTVSLIITDAAKLVGYAVIGFDDQDMVTIYAARSFNSVVAKVAIKAIFGASEVLGVPMRVHTERLDKFARWVGAKSFREVLDGDGIRQGVFGG